MAARNTPNVTVCRITCCREWGGSTSDGKWSIAPDEMIAVMEIEGCWRLFTPSLVVRQQCTHIGHFKQQQHRVLAPIHGVNTHGNASTTRLSQQSAQEPNLKGYVEKVANAFESPNTTCTSTTVCLLMYNSRPHGQQPCIHNWMLQCSQSEPEHTLNKGKLIFKTTTSLAASLNFEPEPTQPAEEQESQRSVKSTAQLVGHLHDGRNRKVRNVVCLGARCKFGEWGARLAMYQERHASSPSYDVFHSYILIVLRFM